MAETASSAPVRVNVPEQDVRSPRRRLSHLFDPGTLELDEIVAGSRVVTARGRIDGAVAVAFCTDGTRMGGALGATGAAEIVAAIETAVRLGRPVIGLWHSGGANLSEGVASLDGIGRIFAAMIHASGRIPQISVVLGPAAGGAAYGPALTDVVIMAPEGRVFVTGPDVVRSVTGEQIDQEGLGGAEAHGRRSGVVHVLATSESDALARARRITGLLTGAPGFGAQDARLRRLDPDFDPGSDADADLDDGLGSERGFEVVDVDAFEQAEQGRPDPRSLLPERPRRAYDVHPLVLRVLDEGPHPFEELQARWAANAVVGLGRLYGQPVGVIANNPIRKGGCLDSLSAEKISRFVRMCDSFGVPLVVLVDVPGYLPGVTQEWDGVVRRGAKLLYAFAEATVPRVTLVTRKSFGGAYIAMNSRALGASAVLAWPEAEVAVMGAEAAVNILHRRALAAAAEDELAHLRGQLVEEHTREAGGVERGISIGVIDAVIEPRDTRRRIAAALAAAPARRGRHGNIPL